jgi:hypothetical protein
MSHKYCLMIFIVIGMSVVVSAIAQCLIFYSIINTHIIFLGNVFYGFLFIFKVELSEVMRTIRRYEAIEKRLIDRNRVNDLKAVQTVLASLRKRYNVPETTKTTTLTTTSTTTSTTKSTSTSTTASVYLQRFKFEPLGKRAAS